MPNQKTHADSVRMYLTGAASDGGAQADPDASLGNYRSSTEVVFLSHTITSPISNITVDFIGGANGEGNGSLAATGVDTLTWTPPGGTAGAAVTILNGETKILEGGGAPGKFIRVTRTSATDLSGTATVATAHSFNNLVGMDNVSSGEAAAGDDEYRGFMFKVESATEVKNFKIGIKKLGTSQVSAAAQLGASGSGSISLSSGNFNDWPSSGFCRIEDNVGALKEIVYYSSRTSTSLTVPSAGRGLLGTAAQAGAATDNIHAVPGIRLATETPVSDQIQTIADESTAPTGVTWKTGIEGAPDIDAGNLAAAALLGGWVHRAVVAGATAEANVLNHIFWSFDAA